MDRIISKIIEDIARENGVDVRTAELIYTDMFKFIRKTLEGKDFSILNTEDDLREAKVNFNIPRIFKLYTTLSRIDYARKAIIKKSSQHDEGVNVSDNTEEAERVIVDPSRSIRNE
jgi:hypothetical protein